MPKSRPGGKAKDQRAHETQAAQERSEDKKLTFEQYQRRRFLGWALVAVGVLVAASHWVQHLGVYELMSPGLSDLLIGYPTGGALAVLGSVVLSR